MMYLVCINLHKVSYKSNLHCWAWWCFINQRHILLEFDNFRIVDLGVRNHSNKKWSFELQSFAIFGFQSLNHILSFFLKIFLIENFGFLTFPFFALSWKRESNIGKSLSEALIFAEHWENMLCRNIVLNVKNNICTQHVLPMFWAWNIHVLNL